MGDLPCEVNVILLRLRGAKDMPLMSGELEDVVVALLRLLLDGEMLVVELKLLFPGLNSLLKL